MTDQEINEAVARKLGWEYHDHTCRGGEGYGAWMCPDPHWYDPKEKVSTLHARVVPGFCNYIVWAWKLVQYCGQNEMDLTRAIQDIQQWDYDFFDISSIRPRVICLAFLKLP